jgi:hypothetical protein
MRPIASVDSPAMRAVWCSLARRWHMSGTTLSKGDDGKHKRGGPHIEALRTTLAGVDVEAELDGALKERETDAVSDELAGAGADRAPTSSGSGRGPTRGIRRCSAGADLARSPGYRKVWARLQVMDDSRVARKRYATDARARTAAAASGPHARLPSITLGWPVLTAQADLIRRAGWAEGGDVRLTVTRPVARSAGSTCPVRRFGC